MKYIKLSKRIFNQSVRLEESIITIFCTGKGVMECETSVMVSEENSKEEDDLLLQSIRKVKRKANEKEIPLEREVEYKKIGGEEDCLVGPHLGNHETQPKTRKWRTHERKRNSWSSEKG